MDSRYRAWSARSAYYLARTLTQQLNGGDDYDRLGAGEPAVAAWITFLEHWQEDRWKESAKAKSPSSNVS